MRRCAFPYYITPKYAQAGTHGNFLQDKSQEPIADRSYLLCACESYRLLGVQECYTSNTAASIIIITNTEFSLPPEC